MTEADILAFTYEDTVTVYRPFKEVLPSGESIFRKDRNGKKVYEHIPCALSGLSGGKMLQTASVAKAPADYSLFVRPETDIRPNDFLVIYQLGKEVEAKAGRPERMASHNNIPVTLKEEV